MEFSDAHSDGHNIFNILVAIRNEIADQNKELCKLNKTVDSFTDNNREVIVVGKD